MAQTCSYTHPEHGDCRIGPHCSGETFRVVDGKIYCPFHFPFTATDGSPTGREAFIASKSSQINASFINYATQCNSSSERAVNLAGTIINFDIDSQYLSSDFYCSWILDDANIHGFLLRSGDSPSISAVGTNFSGVVLLGNKVQVEALFRKCSFREPLTMSGNGWNCKVDFGGSEFHSSVSFNNVQNPESFDLSECIFHDAFNVQSFHVQKSINLKSTNFIGTVYTNGFHCVSADFTGAVFKNKVEFLGGHIRDGIFNKAEFNGYTGFVGVDLLNCAFVEAQFLMPSSFVNTLFSIFADFEKTVFMSDVTFEGDKPFCEMSFSGTNFLGNVRFDNRPFANAVTFSHATFTYAPSFHNCVFHQDMEFPDMGFFKGRDGEKAARAYRTLRLAMEEQRATREQNIFFALEQISYRNSSASRFDEKFMSILYQALANYGLSISRPLGWFIGILLVSSEIYRRYLGFDKETWYTGYVHGLGFGIQQYVKPFSVWMANNTLHNWESLNPIVTIIASVQSLMGITLIALFLLTLRWKFRRG